MDNLYFTIINLLVLSGSIFAQDNHYESLQLGSKNGILSGAAISRWVDQTAVVHNAATMMFAEESGITFNSTAGSIENVKFDNGLGDGVDIDSYSAQLYPGLIAADLPITRDPERLRLGIAIFARVSDRTRFTRRETIVDNVLNDMDSPGDETVIGQFSLDIALTETMPSMAMSGRINENLAYGLALLAPIRSHRWRENAMVTVITDPANNPSIDIVSAETDISLQYDIVMLQLRGSLAWQEGPWNAGLTLTTPSLRVWSSGDMIAQTNAFNIRPEDSDMRRSYFASAYLSRLKPVYKYPISVALGLSRKFEAMRISAAASWYGALDRYVVVDPGETAFIQPPDEENILVTPQFLEVWSNNRNVLNGALSAEWFVSRKITFMGGFRTDLHYAEFIDPDPPGFQLPKRIWNRFHISSGLTLTLKRSRWILGVQYSNGREDNYRQPFSFDGITEDNVLEGDKAAGQIRAHALTGVMSFVFYVERGNP